MLCLQQQTEEAEDYAKNNYGNLPMIQSTERPDRVLMKVEDIDVDQADQLVWLRGRLHTSRSKGEIGRIINRLMKVHIELNNLIWLRVHTHRPK